MVLGTTWWEILSKKWFIAAFLFLQFLSLKLRESVQARQHFLVLSRATLSSAYWRGILCVEMEILKYSENRPFGINRAWTESAPTEAEAVQSVIFICRTLFNRYRDWLLWSFLALGGEERSCSRIGMEMRAKLPSRKSQIMSRYTAGWKVKVKWCWF